MLRNTQWFIYGAGLLLTFLFIWTRLYQLPQTLLFFIDIGRDANVMWDWYHTGRPPLLGPQTSALPFNQSAVYFYLLYPLFVLTQFSAFSTIYSAVLIYGLVFGGLLYLLRNQVRSQLVVLTVWLLVLVHPQFVIQTRFVWNPTLVGPAIIWATASFLQLRRHWNWWWVGSLALSSAAAVSFNFSAMPALLAMGVLSLWYFRKRGMVIGLGMLMALAVFNAPTAFFELRHDFPLTKMMLYQPKLAQTETSFELKLRDITKFGLEMPSPEVGRLMLLVVTGFLVAGYWWYRHLDGQRPDEQYLAARDYQTVLALLGVTLVITFLMPVSILSHYIFGIVSLLLFAVACLPPRLAITLVLGLVIVWVRPVQIQSYLQPARRTVADMERCFQTVCQAIPQPMYVSVQAGFHPFHAAQEHRFLMRKNGCDVPPIDEQPTAANLMAVVVDDSTYDHGQTAYNELTQFGPSTQQRVFNCQDNFQVYILAR